MKIAYLSYWGISDGLTKSTILPALKIIEQIPEVDEIHLLTIEREKFVNKENLDLRKTTHTPLLGPLHRLNAVNKFYDFYFLPSKIASFLCKHNIDLLICRGVMAGAIGVKIKLKIKVPLIIESFEPHALYMKESNEWGKYDLRFIMQKKWEDKQKIYADHIITVTESYKSKLISEGVDKENISVIPCHTNLEEFAFSMKVRVEKRTEMGWINNLIGIYVGKFGGIYYKEKAFQIFSEAFEFFGENFRLIILTPHDQKEIESMSGNVGINREKIFVKWASHEEVKDYLSASDFGFSTIKEAPSRKFCSPVKNGEYWASGLPILLTEGVGDDCDIIETNRIAGSLYHSSLSNLRDSFVCLEQILNIKEHKNNIYKVAEKFRNPKSAKDIYNSLIKKYDGTNS